MQMVRRHPVSENQVYWSIPESKVDAEALDGIDVVVHLAGESITGGRWTKEKKRRIRNSRILGTRLLSRVLAELASPPKVFISASAIGYYGDRGDERLIEESGPGTGYLPEVCRQWEEETGPAAARGIRTVNLRTGIVLSRFGGALPQMLPFFKLGLGGRIGSGRQYMSWITLEDLTGIIEHAIDKESLQGPVNAVSPDPATNLEFTRALGKALSRPALFALPRFAARLAFGEMADALLLASARVIPSRLMDTGFRFQSDSLEEALKRTLSGE